MKHLKVIGSQVIEVIPDGKTDTLVSYSEVQELEKRLTEAEALLNRSRQYAMYQGVNYDVVDNTDLSESIRKRAVEFITIGNVLFTDINTFLTDKIKHSVFTVDASIPRVNWKEQVDL